MSFYKDSKRAFQLLKKITKYNSGEKKDERIISCAYYKNGLIACSRLRLLPLDKNDY